MTADEFRAAADRICADGRREGQALPSTASTSRDYARQLERLLAVNARTRDRLGALDPPSELAGDHRRLLQSNDDGVELTREIIERLRRGDERKAIFAGETGDRIRAIARRTSDAARRLGLRECGSRS